MLTAILNLPDRQADSESNKFKGSRNKFGMTFVKLGHY